MQEIRDAGPRGVPGVFGPGCQKRLVCPVLPNVEVPGAGRSVGRIGLGCMLLSVEDRPTEMEAAQVIRRALECGVDFFDTADVYALDEADTGHNERLLADTLEALGRSANPGDSRNPLVATKGGRVRRGTAWDVDGRPDRIRASCEASLRALRTECIGLYQLHTPDPRVPFADSVGALSRLLEEGKVLAVGVSNVTARQVHEAGKIVRLSTVQNGYGPWGASRSTPPVIRACESAGALFLAHSPFGGKERAAALGGLPFLCEAADRLESTPHEVALAWLLGESPCVVPIPGARSTRSIESSVRATEVVLDQSTRTTLTAGFRKAFTERSVARRVVGRIRGALNRLR